MPSNVGRSQLVSDWNLAVQNGAVKSVLGQGIGGGNGWSPRFGDFLLERAYLQGSHFITSGTSGGEQLYFEVEKNGSTQLYNLEETIGGLGYGSWPSAGALMTGTDSTQHVITPADYICGDIGHRGWTSGETVITKDVGIALEGRYITGPLSGQYVTIGQRGVVRGFHISGSMNGLTYVFNLLGVTDAKYPGGTGWADCTNGLPYTIPVPMKFRRLLMYGTVNNPVIAPDDSDLIVRGYLNNLPTTANTPDMEVVQTLQTSIGQEFSRQRVLNISADTGDEFYLMLQQVRQSGSGSANLIDLSVYLEWEML